jgi:hypothetical protein
VAKQGGEVVLFEDDEVRVTHKRAVIGEDTCAMANVTSVSLREIPADNQLAIWLIVGGLVLSICTIGVSLLAAVGGIVLLCLNKPQYAVVIRSASGEANGLISPDEDYIRRVVKAMNKAIVTRE